MKKILYICKSEVAPLDGGAIFDRRIIQVLERAYDVEVYRVAPVPSKIPPMWAAKIDSRDIADLESKRPGVFCIVSHEVLGRVAEVLKPDIFIFHNIFSEFRYVGRFWLQCYYRLLSKQFEQKIILSSKKICVLSVREREAVFSRGLTGSLVQFFPGINPDLQCGEGPDSCSIRRMGTSDWLPKRLSELSLSQVKQIEALGYGVVDEGYDVRCISLVEDQFLSGFKLKVIEAFQKGDFVFSFADIEEEIKCIDERLLKQYCYVKDFSHLMKLLESREVLVPWVEGDVFPIVNVSWELAVKTMLEE